MGEKHRILAVDDNSDVLSFIELTLSEKYEVITTTDGEDAVSKFKECEPDLVLLDVMMPGLSGYEVCQEMRKVQGKGHIPVIMLSALDSTDDHKAGYHEGATFYLTKPIPQERLLRNIEIQLSSFGEPQPKKLTFDEIKLHQIKPPVKVIKNEPKPVAPVEQKKLHQIQKARILIVDDDPDILNVLKTLFENEYELITATDGMEALRKVTAYEPDLLILDIMLPRINGLQICRAIHKIERFKDLPIIFLTAKDDPKTRQLAEQQGACFINKPADPEILADKVRYFINNYSGTHITKRFTYDDILTAEMKYHQMEESKNTEKNNWVD